MAKRGRIHYRYPRRHFRRRRSGGMTIPIAPIAGLMAGVAGPMFTAINGNPKWAAQQLVRNYTGIKLGGENFDYEGFDIMEMSKGVLPLAMGLLVHKFVGGRPLNANAALARAKVPLIRI